MTKKKVFTRADLNEKQERFVDRYIELGGSREAATTAVKEIYGYSAHAACGHAGRMLKNEKIRDVLAEETTASFAVLGVVAAERLSEILMTGMWFGQAVKPTDGMRAIREGLDRGVGPLEHLHRLHANLQVEGGGSIKELRAEVIQELGKLDPAMRSNLLLQFAPELAVDADFEAIDPDAPWGYKQDGTPKAKPGAPPTKNEGKRLLPEPEAYRPPIIDELEQRKSNIKKRVRKRMIEEIEQKKEATND